MSGTQHVVVGIAIEVLYDVRTRTRLHLSGSTRVVAGVELELQVVEAALVLPEVGIEESRQHHGTLQTGIHIIDPSVGLLLKELDAEGFLQVDRRTGPVAPGVAELIEALHAEVALQRVLSSPYVTVGSPAPGNEALFAVVVLQAEDVLVVGHQAAARVVNHFLGELGSLGHIVSIERTGSTGSVQIYLGQQTRSTVVVDAARRVALGQQRAGLLQRQDDIVVDIGNLHLLYRIVVAGSQ